MSRARLLAPLAILASLTACAIFTPPAHCTDRGDGICWWADPVQIPVTSYRWEIDTTANASARCGYGMDFERATCVMGRLRSTGVVHIVSALTEAEARRINTHTPLAHFGRTKSIWCHELDDHAGLNYCGTNPSRIQWMHPPGPVRPLLEARR